MSTTVVDFSVDKMVQGVIEEVSKQIKSLNRLNVIVVGKTGVGKSTLINNLFREKLAETGIGKPVTQHMAKLTKEGCPLAIYDTRGFELGNDIQEEVKDEILDTIKTGLYSNDINEAIHCILYCINTSSNRIEPEEIEWIKSLSSQDAFTQIPIVVVLTQAFSKKHAREMKSLIEKENLNIKQVVPVLAENYEIDEDICIKSYGLDNLVNVMIQVLPTELVKTFQNVQIASLEQKIKSANDAIDLAVAAAMVEGAVPIPFSDCFVLVPTQVTMLASITVTFGFNISTSILTTIISSTIGTAGASVLGRSVVSNILKLIPGLGSVAGGFISGTTAGIITAALGKAYLKIMIAMFEGKMDINNLDSDEGKEIISNSFKEELKNKVCI